MAGAPVGNTNAAKARIMSSHLRKRIEERRCAEQLMDTLLDKALGGDMTAIKEVFDRVDGKAPQDLNLGGQDKNPIKGLWSIQPVRSANADDKGS